ncbi:MAG: hypothetical protein CMB48_01250 [Euryarchaeota archaeon]|nr:hypothetical protein [Euryarchaeota archaeon]|tara:strand:+ start:10069 stop:11343 length:1275 start_codon:yes stop_codon:yes gene_type:complete
MHDKPGEEKSFLEKMQYWLREESDMQWLSIGVFFMIVIAGAFFFDHSNVIPGWVQSDVTEQGTLMDIDWNDEGDKALAIFLDNGNKNLMSWDGENGWKSIEYDSEPNAVDFSGLDQWFIGTNDGIELWTGVGDSSTSWVMNWADNSSSKRIVDISSLGGVSGFIITQSMDGSEVHYFSGTEVSSGTTPPSTGSEGNSEGHVQLTHVEMIGTQRALVIGSSSVYGINPTNALTIGSLYDVSATETGSPNVQLIHSKAGVELSQIISLNDDFWGDEYIAAVIGPTDCLIISLDGIVSKLCDEGGSSAAIDSYGALWISSATNSLEVNKITPNEDRDGEISYVTRNLQLPENYEINSRLAKSSGEKVHFYGTNDNGIEVKGILDSEASQSVLRSLDMLGQLVVFIIAISVFGATAWQFYENRGRGSW